MVEKPYQWISGATLEEHSKRKHKILREYFARYMAVRCQLPQQARFRFAIVEGFAGAGRYGDGTAGSPIIFIEELLSAAENFNVRRAADKMSPLNIECLLVLNDANPDAIELLKTSVQPLLGAASECSQRLYIEVRYLSKRFEEAYPLIKELLETGGYRSVLFNLDQCGHSHVELSTLADITASFASAEIFYTFAIAALLAFLQKSDPTTLAAQLRFLNLKSDDLGPLQGHMSNTTWLGIAERLVFRSFQRCARYVSPFSINNPDGWRYWLIHFASSYRARQEYNNVLHNNSSLQAHFGRSGLNMLSYDPDHSANSLYLFDDAARREAKDQLLEDIPRLVTDFGDAVGVGEFYESIYNMTPAHMDDVHAAMIESPDLEISTQTGGERRKANTIGPNDVLRMKQQRTFFPIFFNRELRPRKK